MKIKESAENYLETILVLQHRNGSVRAVEIAAELDFSKASVSVAMKQLRENGYIEVDGAGHITLLPAGMEIAQRIYERHQVLTRCLVALGVEERVAAEDACRVEHFLSGESFEKIRAYYERKMKCQKQ